MSESLERIRRHLGKGGYIELKGEDGTVDKFYMPLIPMKLYGEYWEVASKLRNANDESFASSIDKETFTQVVMITKETLKLSPDFEGISDSDIEQFVTANISPVMMRLFELNDFGASRIADEKAIEAAKRIREKMNATRNEPTPSGT